jgi:ribosomal protein L14E/L6E/L27E
MLLSLPEYFFLSKRNPTKEKKISPLHTTISEYPNKNPNSKKFSQPQKKKINQKIFAKTQMSRTPKTTGIPRHHKTP